jgi:cytochrome P450
VSTTVTLNRIPDALAALRNEHLAQSLYDEGKVIMDGTLLTLHGAAHRNRRLLEFRVFRRSFFRFYETQVFPRALAEVMSDVAVAGGCDLVEFGFRITMNLTADFAGVDRPERSARETAALLAMVRTFSEGATMVHTTRDKNELRREVLDALQEFDTAFLRPSIARRTALLARHALGEIDDTALPRDVLTVLLRNEDQLDLPRDLVCREIAFYLQAGSHSTANSTVHAMHDVLTWTAAHPEDRERMANDPIFLQRCVHESLRLHPASPVAWRKPVCPLRLAGGAEVGPDDRVEIDLWSANRSKEAFGEDADSFNPHRTVVAGNEPFGLTFGTGVHTCLGRDLDGGLVPKGEVDPAQHQFGIIALLVKALLDAGAVPDPDRAAAMATHTARPNWGSYPVLFR